MLMPQTNLFDTTKLKLVIILFVLQFNISADSKGNPQYICTKIKHPVGGNTTICSSQYQHNHSLVVTVHWMFDPSVVNPCGLNLTVQLTAVDTNSNPIIVNVGKLQSVSDHFNQYTTIKGINNANVFMYTSSIAQEMSNLGRPPSSKAIIALN